MCEPATIAALAASAIGTGLQYSAQKDAADRQTAAIDSANNEQQGLAKEKQSAVIQAAQRFTAPSSTQSVVQPAQDRLTGVAEQAQSNLGGANSPSAGMVSQDYSLDRAKRAADEMRRAISVAQNTAAAGNPARMMMNQGLGLADSMGGVDNIASLMKQAANRGQTSINKAGMVDPGMMAAGSLLSGASGAIGGMFKKAPIVNKNTAYIPE